MHTLRSYKEYRAYRISMLALICAFLAMCSAADSSAANIVEVKRGIAIVGTIVRGDDEIFAKILLARKAARNPVRGVMLSSNGGDIKSALQIGRLIRLNWITTVTMGKIFGQSRVCQQADGSTKPMDAGTSCTCDSACFLIWSAGISRSSTGTIVGLHRPYFGSIASSTLSEPDVNASYQKTISEVREYLREMNIPDRYFEVMMSKSSVEIYRLSDDEVDTLKYSPLAEEAIIKTCGTIWDRDTKWLEIFKEYADRQYVEMSTGQKSQTPHLDALIDAPLKEIMNCRNDVFEAAQNRLQGQ